MKPEDPRFRETKDKLKEWLPDVEEASLGDYAWHLTEKNIAFPVWGFYQRTSNPDLLFVSSGLDISEFRALEVKRELLLDLAAALSFFGLSEYGGLQPPLGTASLRVSLSTNDLRHNDVLVAKTKIYNAGMYLYWTLKKHATGLPEEPAEQPN